ncbi:MAG: DUF305 domain-containing protein, partial [Ilumatobacteraceae bacterium]
RRSPRDSLSEGANDGAAARGVGPSARWQTSPVDVRTDVEPVEPPVVGAFTDEPDGESGDVVVLSWWQHPVNVIGLVIAIALIGGMVGWLVADPGGDAGGGGEVDVGFLHDMRAHHEQAAQMGFMFLALEDTDPGLRTVARSIVTGQNQEIGRMIQLLRDFGAPEAAETEAAMAWMGMATTVDQMPGMASEAELDALGATSGAAADELFVELMVDHHGGGLHMAETAADDAEDSRVRSLAASIVTSQSHEIGELQQLVG